MKVLWVAEFLGSAYGQERVTHHSVQYLTQRGWETAFICAKTTRPLPNTLQVPGLFSLHSLSPRARVRAALRAIGEFAAQQKPDLIHFADIPDYRILKKLSRYPCVATAHTVSPTCPASHRMIPQGVCEKQSGWTCLWHNRSYGCLDFLRSDLRRAHAILNYLRRRRMQRRHHLMLAPSRFILDVLQKDGFDTDRIRLVYNPVVAEATAPKHPTPLLVAAHRLVPLKGLGDGLKALSALRDLPWELKVCGDGPEGSALRALAEELKIGDRVEFLGRLDREAMLPWLCRAWAVLQCNRGPESFGMSAAEASLLGTPVIGYDLPALNEIVTPETGALVPRGDLGELVTALRYCLVDREWSERTGAEARARTQRLFSLKNHGETLEQTYQELLS